MLAHLIEWVRWVETQSLFSIHQINNISVYCSRNEKKTYRFFGISHSLVRIGIHFVPQYSIQCIYILWAINWSERPIVKKTPSSHHFHHSVNLWPMYTVDRTNAHPAQFNTKIVAGLFSVHTRLNNWMSIQYPFFRCCDFVSFF